MAQPRLVAINGTVIDNPTVVRFDDLDARLDSI